MSEAPRSGADALRAATFNASLNRATEGELVSDLSAPDDRQAQTVAEIVQRAAPSILLVNEFDYDAAGAAAGLFRSNYLDRPQDTLGAGPAAPADHPYAFVAPSSTGVASGFDLNNDGRVVTAPGAPGYGDDALGFGAFPGQYGMALFSRYPILTDQVRTFQTFLWKDMPGARLPDDPSTPAPADWYSAEELAVFRLPSKSFWDVPVLVDGRVVHVIALHPTPPTFDGPEDRNGLRNADEIRLAADYVTPGQGTYIYDDQGRFGGLEPGARFVVMGDMNADPSDGDSVDAAIRQLLDSPAVDALLPPTSAGGPEQARLQGGANATHRGNPLFDTADFADTAPGNLRVDYVLPSAEGLAPRTAGVFWPRSDDPLFPLVGTFDPGLPGGFPGSDHRLTWTDLALVPGGDQTSVRSIQLLGEADIPFGATFGGLAIAGLSAITYDAGRAQYYVLSDDRSSDARFFTVRLDLSDGRLADGDVSFTGVQALTDAAGARFAANSLDPEGLALGPRDTLFLSSEGDANAPIPPFVYTFDLGGRQTGALEIDAKFLSAADRSSGIRNNLAFEALALTPDGGRLYVGTENALEQDGLAAALGTASPSRITEYDAATGHRLAEFVYVADPVTAAPVPAATFANNGLVELLALDDRGTLLALERSFSTGVGNDIRLYLVRTEGATDVSDAASLQGLGYEPVQKTLLLDLATLGLVPDNVEGMTFGPDLPDGRKTLVLVSDDNFSPAQTTRFIALGLDLDLGRASPAPAPDPW